MSRSTTGALIAASAVIAVGLLSGCGAGRLTQTSNQVPPVPGTNADIVIEPHDGAIVDPIAGQIALRNVAIAFGDPAGYPTGGTAPLTMHIVNDTRSPVTLTAITLTRGGGVATLIGGASPTPTRPSSPAPSASASVGAPASATASASAPGASPTASAPGASPTASSAGAASASASPAPAALNVVIPADGRVDLAPEAGRYLAITGLAKALGLDRSVELAFTFTLADGRTVGRTLTAPFATPFSPLPRSPIELPSEA